MPVVSSSIRLAKGIPAEHFSGASELNLHFQITDCIFRTGSGTNLNFFQYVFHQSETSTQSGLEVSIFFHEVGCRNGFTVPGTLGGDAVNSLPTWGRAVPFQGYFSTTYFFP